MNKVKSDDLSEILKSCGVIIIDISRDIASLSKGKEIFRTYKRKISKLKKKDNTRENKNKRLIVLLSTVMTWAGVNNKVSCNFNTQPKECYKILLLWIFTIKKFTVNKNCNMKNRTPNPAFMEHYEFELEVLAVNQTIGVK